MLHRPEIGAMMQREKTQKAKLLFLLLFAAIMMGIVLSVNAQFIEPDLSPEDATGLFLLEVFRNAENQDEFCAAKVLYLDEAQWLPSDIHDINRNIDVCKTQYDATWVADLRNVKRQSILSSATAVGIAVATHYAEETTAADGYDIWATHQSLWCGVQPSGDCTPVPTRTPFAGCQHSIDPRIGSDCGAWDHHATPVPRIIVVGPAPIEPNAAATIFQGARDRGNQRPSSSGNATPSAEQLNRQIHQGSRRGQNVDKLKNEYRRRYGNPCRFVNGRVRCVH